MNSLPLFVALFFHSAFGAECGDQSWSLYQNEKCFKVVYEFVTKGQAIAICRQVTQKNDHAPEILTIKNPPEQAFIKNLLYGSGQVFDNFWVGATRRGNGGFFWDKDNSPVVFTNWASGYPTSAGDGSDCLQLTSRIGKNATGGLNTDGLWKNVPCIKRNFVVCQKQAILTPLEMQDLRFNLKNNPVPVGFIYTQFPNKPTPQTIWPNLVWSDVSSQYAGLFFRALGGTSASFGSVQPESTKRLTRVETRWLQGDGGGVWGTVATVPGQWSQWSRSSHHLLRNKDMTDNIRFEISNDEIKPRNMAIRVWQRMQ